MRIIRQLLVESLLLAAIAGGLGVLLAKWCLNAITGMTSFTLPRTGEIRLDLIAIAFATLVSVVTGLLFGLTPALSISWAVTDRPYSLGFATVGALYERPRFSTRGLLVAGQVALSVILLIGATLLMESIGRLHRGRSPQPLPDVQLKVKGRTVNMGLPQGWMKEHPLTLEDLEQERQYLKEAGFRLNIV